MIKIYCVKFSKHKQTKTIKQEKKKKRPRLKVFYQFDLGFSKHLWPGPTS